MSHITVADNYIDNIIMDAVDTIKHLYPDENEIISFVNELTLKQVDELLQDLNNQYYSTGISGLADEEYDSFLEQALNVYPELRDKYSGVVTEEADLSNDSIELPFYLGSLDKIKTEKEIDNFTKKLGLGIKEVIITPKLDGLSAFYDVSNRKLYTRGDGIKGRNITRIKELIFGIMENYGNMKNLPLPSSIDIEYGIGIRGEMVMRKDVFAKKYSSTFKNSRNMICGCLNKAMSYSTTSELKKDKTLLLMLKDIQFVAYDIYCNHDTIYYQLLEKTVNNNIMDRLYGLQLVDDILSHNFQNENYNDKIEDTNLYYGIHFMVMELNINCYNDVSSKLKKTFDSLLKAYKNVYDNNYNYEIDGIVVRAKDQFYNYETMMETKKNPKYAIAYKNNDISVSSSIGTVHHINWNISKHGYSKPTIILETPIICDSSSVQNVTGFNAKFIVMNKIRKGTKLRIGLSGGIIPHIFNIIDKDGGTIELIEPSRHPEWVPDFSGSNKEDVIYEVDNEMDDALHDLVVCSDEEEYEYNDVDEDDITGNLYLYLPDDYDDNKYRWSDNYVDLIINNEETNPEIVIKKNSEFFKIFEMKCGLQLTTLTNLYRSTGIYNLRNVLELRVDEWTQAEKVGLKKGQKMIDGIKEGLDWHKHRNSSYNKIVNWFLLYLEALQCFDRGVAKKKILLCWNAISSFIKEHKEVIDDKTKVEELLFNKEKILSEDIGIYSKEVYIHLKSYVDSYLWRLPTGMTLELLKMFIYGVHKSNRELYNLSMIDKKWLYIPSPFEELKITNSMIINKINSNTVVIDDADFSDSDEELEIDETDNSKTYRFVFSGGKYKSLLKLLDDKKIKYEEEKTVNKDIDILVMLKKGAGTTKEKKADKLGKPIMDHEEFYSYIDSM